MERGIPGLLGQPAHRLVAQALRAEPEIVSKSYMTGKKT